MYATGEQVTNNNVATIGHLFNFMDLMGVGAPASGPGTAVHVNLSCSISSISN